MTVTTNNKQCQTNSGLDSQHYQYNSDNKDNDNDNNNNDNNNNDNKNDPQLPP